jgi:DNA-binding GntR family transcriptional regulator
MPPATAAQARSLTNDVYERLRVDILACRLKPSAKLRIGELCDAFGGVSLGAVREALSRLAADGLVVAVPQRGFTVAPVSSRDLEELTLARVEIETLCLRAAIAKGGVTWEVGIVAAFRALTTTPYVADNDAERLADTWVAKHAAFHHALVAAADNTWLLRIREQLYQQSERYRRLSVPVAPHRRDVDSEHRGIMQATLERDAEAAARKLADHLHLTTRILLQANLPQEGEEEWVARPAHSE